MRFGIYLVRKELLNPEEFLEILDQQLSEQPLLGALAIKSGKLTMRQVFEVLKTQADSSEQFGAVAVQLGFMGESDVSELLIMQMGACRSLSEILIEGGYLPRSTVTAELEQYRLESVVVKKTSSPASNGFSETAKKEEVSSSPNNPRSKTKSRKSSPGKSKAGTASTNGTK